MFKNTIATGVVASFIGLAPQTAQADLKDGIIGGVVGGAVGALVTEGIRNNKSNKQRSTSTRSTTNRAVSSQAPSLNSQYSRAERRQIQTSLNNLGYNVGAVDGVLGKRSRAGIRSFQATRGEPQTGQLTAAQYAVLTSPAGLGSNQTAFGTGQAAFGTTQAAFGVNNRPLQANEVMLLQQSLWQMGLFQGAPDGVNSPATQSAAANFLASQNRNPVQTTQVQTLVLAATAVGQMVPQYLIDEANAQQAATQGNNAFGAAPQQQQGNGFGTTLATQQQPATGLFGAPAQGQTQPAAQAQPLFGAQPQPQQQAPANTTTTLFGTAPQQQPQQQQPVQQQPVQQQQPQAQGVLVSAPQPEATQGAVVSTMGTTTQATQSTTDLFSGGQQSGGAGTMALQSTSAEQPAAAQAGQTLDIFSGSQ